MIFELKDEAFLGYIAAVDRLPTCVDTTGWYSGETLQGLTLLLKNYVQDKLQNILSRPVQLQDAVNCEGNSEAESSDWLDRYLSLPDRVTSGEIKITSKNALRRVRDRIRAKLNQVR